MKRDIEERKTSESQCPGFMETIRSLLDRNVTCDLPLLVTGSHASVCEGVK